MQRLLPGDEVFRTSRLMLRAPCREDAAALFHRFAADAEVTRFLAWPRHTCVADTEAFVAFAQAEWTHWPAGPLLITARSDGTILGSTGLAFETAYRASTGFVLARDAWGSGFASEAVRAVVRIVAALEVRRLYALCHVQHTRSARVLERSGFALEGVLRRHTLFPNLGAPEPQDVCCYAQMPAGPSSA